MEQSANITMTGGKDGFDHQAIRTGGGYNYRESSPVKYQPEVVTAVQEEDGVGGSGEELAQTLEKIISQLDIISITCHVLEQRVSINEESVKNV